MTYLEWIEEHSIKHKKIIEKLAHLNDGEIIEYFLYENMIKNEPSFCLLYIENKKCHEIKDLNCYLCACPEFRLQEEKKVKSYCSINSKFSATCKANDEVHQDCSDCLIPHKKQYIKKVFDRDWNKVMKDVGENGEKA